MYMKKSTLIISCFAGISMVALAGCGDSSSGTDAKDAADEASEKYFPDIKSGSCDFKKEDKVWKYTSTAEADGDVSVVARYYTYKKGGSIDSNVVVTTGEDVKMACKYADEEVYDDEQAGSKISSTCSSISLCCPVTQETTMMIPKMKGKSFAILMMMTCGLYKKTETMASTATTNGMGTPSRSGGSKKTEAYSGQIPPSRTRPKPLRTLRKNAPSTRT